MESFREGETTSSHEALDCMLLRYCPANLKIYMLPGKEHENMVHRSPSDELSSSPCPPAYYSWQ